MSGHCNTAFQNVAFVAEVKGHRFGEVRARPVNDVVSLNHMHITAAFSAHVSHLVAPLQHVFLTVLQLVVDVKELDDAVLPDVVGILLGFLPVERRTL